MQLGTEGIGLTLSHKGQDGTFQAFDEVVDLGTHQRGIILLCSSPQRQVTKQFTLGLVIDHKGWSVPP